MPTSLRTVGELGAAIRDRRRALGLSQQDLAELVGASRQWIVGIEGGHERAELGLLLRTLNALGLVLTLDDGESTDAGGDSLISAADIDALVDASRGGRS